MAHHDAPAVDDLLEDLKRSGHRATTARRAVLEALVRSGDDHLTADELAEQVQRTHPEIHLSTVYRNLDALCDAGLLAPARFADRPSTYHLAGDHHHHAVCSVCGATLVLPDEILAGVNAQLLAEFGFHASPRHLTISGMCARCRAETSA